MAHLKIAFENRERGGGEVFGHEGEVWRINKFI